MTKHKYSSRQFCVQLRLCGSFLYKDKVKVKLSLYVINPAPHHEDVWGSGGMAPPFLTWALDRGEWLASHLCHFTPGESAPDTHWIGG
jgi:hypothetical protein